MIDGDDAEYLGKFHLATSDVDVSGTILLRRGEAPELRLNGELTSWFEPGEGSGSISEQADVEDLIIYGRLVGSPHRITLVGCYTISRRGEVFGELAEQTLRARYAIIGAELQDNELTFDHVSLRFNNVDDWARLPGFGLNRRIGEPGATITYTHSEPETMRLEDRSQLSMQSELHAPWQNDPRAMQLERLAWFQIDDAPALTWLEIDRAYVRPLQSYLQMCTLARCGLTDIRVGRSGTTWPLVHESLSPRSTRLQWAGFPLLLSHTGLDTVVEWLDCVSEFSPSSAIVSDFVASRSISLESDLLELCTVAEGLHRSSFPQRYRLDPETTGRIKRFIHCILVGEDDRTAAIVKGRYNFIEEMSYPERLKDLANEAELALPGISGTTKKWVKLISDARNTFAHGKQVSIDESLLDNLVVAVTSLQWVLYTCLLLNTGVPPSRIAERVGQHQRYHYFMAEAVSRAPKVYPRSAQGPLRMRQS